MNTKKNDLHPNFKDAQTLFTSYTTLQSKEVLENTLIDTLDKSILTSLDTQNAREIYNRLILKYYPNELSVKSSFINQFLFKTKNDVTIFELPVGGSRADLCKVNGSSVAYEIKTDLDNLLRLNKQLNDYLEIFDKTFVICSESKLVEIESATTPLCGIYTYTISKRGTYRFQLIRDAALSEQINPKKQLNVLRKQELIKNFSVGSLTSRSDMSSLIIKNYSSSKINEIFKKILKSRYQDQWNFLKSNQLEIFEIDYQWFFKNTINPNLIYN